MALSQKPSTFPCCVVTITGGSPPPMPGSQDQAILLWVVGGLFVVVGLVSGVVSWGVEFQRVRGASLLR